MVQGSFGTQKVFYVDFRYFSHVISLTPLQNWKWTFLFQYSPECFLKQADVSSLERNGTNVTMLQRHYASTRL